MIDLFDNPKAVFAPNFDAYQCGVLGVRIGSPSSVLSGWEVETNDHGWSHLHGGVGFKVREGFVYQIRLPKAFFERLGVESADDFIRELGNYDGMRRILHRDQLLTCGYLWNKGILVWWDLLPKNGLAYLVIFDPTHGVAEDSKSVSFALDSGEECHRAAPDTFELPSKERREHLVEGDLVKLMFRIAIDDKEFVERMWVRVTEVNTGSYAGLLDNDPYSTNEIHSGMRIEFRPEHVIQIWVNQSSRGVSKTVSNWAQKWWSGTGR